MQIVDKYEYKGFELGEYVSFGGKNAKIIAFDSDCYSGGEDVCIEAYYFEECMNFNTVFYECNDTIIILSDNIKSKNYKWVNVCDIGKLPMGLQTKSEVSVKVKYDSGINPLLEIRKCIGNETFKFEVYGESFCISLYDSEVPITWDNKRGLELDCEICNVNLTTNMITDVKNVMQIIQDSLDWFKSCLGSKND